jgi:hypothetical protein
VTNDERRLGVALEYYFMEARIEEEMFKGGDKKQKLRK